MGRKHERERHGTGRGTRYDEAEHEEIREDEPYEDSRFGSSARIEGEMIGMSAEELLDFARKRMGEEHGMVDKLMRNLPRKFEKRIEALREPRHDAERAIVAAKILIGNARKPLEGGEYRRGDADSD